MKSSFIFAFLFLSLGSLVGERADYPKAKVSFNDFRGLVDEVEAYRNSRLIDFDQFLEISRRENVVILDTRSKFRYDRIHIAGAKHLNFSDFTQSRLLEVIPDFSTTVLIYCNNNFDGNQIDFASKVVVSDFGSLGAVGLKRIDIEGLAKAPDASGVSVASQITSQEKPLMMALNIPTFINLYGYGYRNVYELHELLDVADERIKFEGSIITD